MNFTIVIPTCNRSESLYRTLLSLAKNRCSKRHIEIIVIDNSFYKNESGATQNKVRLVQPFLDISYHFSPIGGPSPARNLGIKHSKYSPIIFIDDDIIVPPDFIDTYESAWLKHPSAKIIGGKITPNFIGYKPKHINQEFLWVFASQDLGNKPLELKYPASLLSANLSIKINRQEKHGVFNETLGRRYFSYYCLFGEDLELCNRLQLAHSKIVYCPTIKVQNVIEAEKLRPKYYWKRILNGGIERHLLVNELKKVNQNFNEYFDWSNILHDLRIARKNVINNQHQQHVLWENVVYALGYIFFGQLMKIYLLVSQKKSGHQTVKPK